MPKDIYTAYPTNRVLYFITLDSTGGVYNATSLVSELPSDTNWSTYAEYLTESNNSGIYEAGFLALPEGSYSTFIYEQLDVSPNSTDLIVGGGDVPWTGSREANILDVKDQTDQMLFDSNSFIYSSATVSGTVTDPNVALIKAVTDRLKFDPDNNVLSDSVSGNLNHFVGWVAPDNTDIVSIKAKTDQMLFDGSSKILSTAVVSGGMTDPNIALIKAQTDKMLFDGSNYIRAHIMTNDDKVGYNINLSQSVTGTQVAGSVGRVLQLARAQARGNWVIDPDASSLTLYDTDGTLLVVFSLAPYGGPYKSRITDNEG